LALSLRSSLKLWVIDQRTLHIVKPGSRSREKSTLVHRQEITEVTALASTPLIGLLASLSHLTNCEHRRFNHALHTLLKSTPNI
jgi:hypothetical protein